MDVKRATEILETSGDANLKVVAYLWLSGYEGGLGLWLSEELTDLWDAWDDYEAPAEAKSTKEISLGLIAMNEPAVAAAILVEGGHDVDLEVLIAMDAISPREVDRLLWDFGYEHHGCDVIDWLIVRNGAQWAVWFSWVLITSDFEASLVERIANQVPEALWCLEDWSVKECSRGVAEHFLLRGMGRKLEPSILALEGMARYHKEIDVEGYLKQTAWNQYPTGPSLSALLSIGYPIDPILLAWRTHIDLERYYTTQPPEFREKLEGYRRYVRDPDRDPTQLDARLLYMSPQPLQPREFEWLRKTLRTTAVAHERLQSAKLSPEVFEYLADWTIWLSSEMIELALSHGYGRKVSPQALVKAGKRVEDYAQEIDLVDCVRENPHLGYYLVDHYMPPVFLASLRQEATPPAGESMDRYAAAQSPEYQADYAWFCV